MSRVGKAPVFFDDKVQVSVDGQKVTVKGGKSEQIVNVNESINIAVDSGKIELTRKNDEQQTRAYHGLYRALLQNAVTGVSKGWTKTLILNGVGYRASSSGQNLELNLGYSHPIKYEVPKGVEVKVEKQTTIHFTSADRSLVGQVAAKVRDFRPPEPYLGKGVKYSDEQIRRKAGKSAGK